MLSLYFVWSFVLIVLEPSKAYLSRTETEITLSLMQELEISHCILITEKNKNETGDLYTFKNFASSNIATIHQNLDFLIAFLKAESYPDQKTIIVLKIQKLATMIEFLENLTEVEKCYKIKIFAWLTFVDWSKSSKEDEYKLLIPLNWQFLVVHQTVSMMFDIVEIYKIGNLTLFFNYARWSKSDGLRITNLDWYQRRSNLKNLTMPLIGFKGLEKNIIREDCEYIDTMCSFRLVLKWLASVMNFRLKEEVKKDHWRFALKDIKDLAILDFPINVNYHTTDPGKDCQTTGAILPQHLNWYIKKPETYKRNDFYLQPFRWWLWAAIFVTLGVTCISTTLQHFLIQTYIDKKKSFEFFLTLFTPFDCFTNQNGTKNSNRSSARISIFAIRFVALFISNIYLATVTSFTAVEILQLPFKNLKEFVENGEYVVELPEDYYPERRFFEESNDPILLQIKKQHYKVKNDSGVDVCSGKIVLADYFVSLADFKNENHSCNIHVIQPPLQISGAAILMSKTNPLKKIFNYHLVRFYSSGIRHRIYMKYHNFEADPEKKFAYDSIEFIQISQLVTKFLSGVVIAIIIFFCELVFKSISSAQNGTNDVTNTTIKEERKKFCQSSALKYNQSSALNCNQSSAKIKDFTVNGIDCHHMWLK